MKRIHIFLFLLLVLYVNAFAQVELNGYVTDEAGEPLNGVIVREMGTSNYVYSDSSGYFSFNSEYHYGTLEFIHSGYWPEEYGFDEESGSAIDVTLYFIEEEEEVDEGQNDIFYFGFSASYTPFSFNSFSSLPANTLNFISESDKMASMKFGFTSGKVLVGYNIGMSRSGKTEGDSIKTSFRKFSYGMQLGYQFIDSKRFSLAAYGDFSWNRYRMLSYPAEKKIGLDTYLNDPQPDIRFNHILASPMLDIAWKFYYPQEYSYWALGIYGGYVMPLNKNTWLYSDSNRLESDGRISYDGFITGIYLTINTF